MKGRMAKLPGIRRNMGVISSWCQLTHCWQIRLLGPLLLSAAPRHRGGILGRPVWTVHHLLCCEKASSQSIKLHMLSRNLRCMRSHNGGLWGHGGVSEPERRMWCHRKHFTDCWTVSSNTTIKTIQIRCIIYWVSKVKMAATLIKTQYGKIVV